MSRVFKVDYIPDPDRGRPLWNAKIFVGVANQDPTIPSNQIQLTGDIGFPVGQSIPVPQPVRTNAGGITVYNNSPLDLNAPGQEYAIQIFDRNDNLIYNFPQVDGVVAMDTTSQEEVTGLIIHPDVGIAIPGQTVDAGVTAFRAVLNGSSRLFTTDRPVVTSGLLNSIVINQEYGTGTADVDGEIYQLRDYTTQTQEEITGVDYVNVTQDQVDAGFDLFPLIGQGIRVAGVGLWVVPSVTADGSPMPNPAILDGIPTSAGFVTINGGTEVYLEEWLYTATFADIRDFGAMTGIGNAQKTRSALLRALRYLDKKGGGSLFIYPDIPLGNYYLSDEVMSNYPNIKIHLYTNLLLNWSDGTNPKSAISIRGQDTANALKGIAIYGNGYIIDGNGVVQNGNGYVYSTGIGEHALLLEYCDKALVQDVELRNGLVDCAKSLRCSGTRFIRAKFNGSVNDNGLSFSQDPDNYNIANKATWANGVAIDCEAVNCEDYGMTSFNASGCVLERPYSRNCGTNSSPHGDAAGYAGGAFSLEAVGGKSTRCKIIDGRGEACTSSGYFITGNNCELVRCEMDGVTVNTGDVGLDDWKGHAVAQLAGNLKITGGEFQNATRNGYYALASELGTGSLILLGRLQMEGNCKIHDNGTGGIDVRGVQNINIAQEVEVYSNGGDEIFIHNNNGYNEGEGEATVRAIVNHSGPDRLVVCTFLRKADISMIRGTADSTTTPIIVNNCNTAVTTENSIINFTANLPTYLAEVTNVTDHFVWGNYGKHTAATSVLTTATNIFGMAEPQNDATSWSDPTAEANFNALLSKLRSAGVLGE